MAKDDLEYLLDKSARLLKWHEFNQHDKAFKDYFNNHFYNIRTLGYSVCCSEINSGSVEVYFRALTLAMKFAEDDAMTSVEQKEL